MTENKLSKFDLKALSQIDLNDLRELDFNESGDWPLALKVVFMLLSFIVALTIGYFLMISSDVSQLDSLEKKEMDLKSSYQIKSHTLNNYDAYQQQLIELNKMLGKVLKELPQKDEVPSLLLDISSVGRNNNLVFELFEPQPPINKEFFAELPIKIKVIGTYEDFGKFVADVTSLPRIVTITDIKIEPSKSKNSHGNMSMELTAKTYRDKQEDKKVKAEK